MGSCLGCSSQTEGDKQNAALSKQLEKEKKQFHKVKKILFLGSGGSGKSTIFKQLRGIYGTGFTQNERHTFVAHIHEQCINQMKLALDVLDEYRNGDTDNILHQNEKAYIDHSRDSKDNEYDDDDGYNEYDDDEIPELSEQALEAQNFLNEVHYTHYQLNDDIVSALKCLWAEPAIKKMYEMRNITKIEDSSAYFWDKLDTLNTKDYVPDESDILLVRYRTTGATEEKYEMPENKGSFSIIDVGGQKSERKKWIKCFDGVTAVIFVASLSCYDEVLYEDYSTNSMTDQLELFDDICNNEALKETSMILFLNKKDLFADKIQRVALQKCLSFIDYGGDSHSFDQTTKYIRKAFTSLNEMPNRKNIFTHITCATDQDNIQKVFADVQHIVIEASLIQAGLMDWDDNQRYKSVDSGATNTEEAQYNDPETAKVIRQSIVTSNKQKSLYNSSNFPMLTSVSTVSQSMMRTNFREIIKKKSIPQLDCIEYSHVLGQYQYNDINKNCINFNDEQGLLNCKVCWAQSTVPNKIFSHKQQQQQQQQQQQETFMVLSIEPNIGIQTKINRKKVNLTVILDVGKSMNNEFTDGHNKMDVTKQIIIDIIKTKLTKNDRFGLVIFDMQTKVIQEMECIQDIDINRLISTIKDHIQCSQHSLPSQKVDFEAFKDGVSRFRKIWVQKKQNTEYENRIIMITTSRLSEKTLSEASNVCNNEEMAKRVYSSFIGINNRFSLQRTKMKTIRGCNFFSIYSSEQLKEKVITRFDEIVTPLMFNLKFVLKKSDNDGGGQCIESIYRLNDDQYDDEFKYNKRNKGKILEINTIFLTKYDINHYDEDENNSLNNKYILLIKLSSQTQNNYDYDLSLKYENHKTQKIENIKSISLQRAMIDDMDENEENKEDALLNGSSYNKNNNNNNDYYDNDSIRKAILLSRYVHVLREWIKSNHKMSINKPNINGLNVSSEFKQKFQEFTNYFQRETHSINNDKSLNKEINVLHALYL